MRRQLLSGGIGVIGAGPAIMFPIDIRERLDAATEGVQGLRAYLIGRLYSN